MNRFVLVVFLIIIVPFRMNSQKKLKNHLFQDENSATTENKINIAKLNIDKAYIAYSNDNLEKSKYFIDQSQKQGVKSGDFYLLLGAYMYRTQEFKAAKRYWKIAHKEGGCWECKSLLDKLENEEPTSDIIAEKVKDYIGEKGNIE